uniref:Uncharacterized protein n=1 Tax=Glossina palpalis gambiensis TaxID=67801 RepID=A0A1B0BHM8_9MUSC
MFPKGVFSTQTVLFISQPTAQQLKIEANKAKYGFVNYALELLVLKHFGEEIWEKINKHLSLFYNEEDIK